MKIYKEFQLDLDKKEIISFVGGGGKTTSMFALGKELRKLGKKVLITTTTKIADPREGYDYYFLGNIPQGFKPDKGSISLVGEDVRGRKFIGLSLDKLDEIVGRAIFDLILIEADGANRLPIKAMAAHEPVVYEDSTRTIAIVGADSLNRAIKDIVHRPELFVKIVDKDMGELVTEGDIAQLVLHPQGIFKTAQGKRIFFLNKVNNEEALRQGRLVRQILKEQAFPGQILLGDIRQGLFY